MSRQNNAEYLFWSTILTISRIWFQISQIIFNLAIILNESTQVDKIEEGFYAVEYEENKFVEIRLPQKADVIFHFETIIRTKADYARSGLEVISSTR